MISRVAESCFWLLRYMERAESCARLVGVNRLIVLDANVETVERWRPVIIVVGERERFEALVGTSGYHDDDGCEDYLTWSEKNPVSIRNDLYWARENARMIREVISREMWEILNTWWQWFNGRAAQREYRKDRTQFYQRLRSMCAEFHGVSQDTMLHEEPWEFMQLGMALERANQTTRLMDVTHHRVGAGDQGGNDRVTGERGPDDKLANDKPASGKPTLETPWQSAQWVSQLKLCAADEPFLKRNRSAPTGSTVAEFLLQDPSFPRSVRHCFERAEESLGNIEVAAERRGPTPSLVAVRAMVDRLRSQDIASVIQRGLHAELTHVVDTTASVCDQLHEDFFDPSTELAVAAASRAPRPPEASTRASAGALASAAPPANHHPQASSHSQANTQSQASAHGNDSSQVSTQAQSTPAPAATPPVAGAHGPASRT